MSSTPTLNSLAEIHKSTRSDSQQINPEPRLASTLQLYRKGGNKDKGTADKVTVMKRSAAASDRRDLGEIDYPINVRDFICGGGGDGVGAGGLMVTRCNCPVTLSLFPLCNFSLMCKRCAKESLGGKKSRNKVPSSTMLPIISPTDRKKYA